MSQIEPKTAISFNIKSRDSELFEKGNNAIYHGLSIISVSSLDAVPAYLISC